jgi:peroxiredoxin
MLYLFVAAAIAGATPANVPQQANPTPMRVAALAPGDPAPPFTLKGSDGRTYRLQDYRGKQAIVIAWFAKSFTGG